MSYATTLVTPVRFVRRSYDAGAVVTVLGRLVDDGVFLARFEGGEETYLAAWRVERPPARMEALPA